MFKIPEYLFEVDFHGQKLVEELGQAIIINGFVIGFALGWFKQSLNICVYIWIASLFIAMIVCVPPWPFYRRHPTNWLPTFEEEEDEDSEDDKDTEASDSDSIVEENLQLLNGKSGKENIKKPPKSIHRASSKH